MVCIELTNRWIKLLSSTIGDNSMDYLLFLQNIRLASASIFDSFMIKVTELGQPLFTFLLLAFIYWCVDKRSGQLMAFNVSFACWLNQWSKKVFKIERPWIRDERITPVEAVLGNATGFSMPSGHTSRALATIGVFGTEVFKCEKFDKKPRRWIGAFAWIIVIFVMFSRNYLGVHTFADVFVALILGIVIMQGCEYILSWVEQGTQNSRRDIVVCIIGCIIIFLPMLRFGCLSNAGTSFGFLIGWLLERRFLKFNTSGTSLRKIVRFIPGAAVVFICFTSGTTIAGHIVPEKYAGFFLQGFASFFIIFLYPLLFYIWESQRITEGRRKILKRWVAIVISIMVLFSAIAGMIRLMNHLPEFTQKDILLENVEIPATEEENEAKAETEEPNITPVEDEGVKIIAHRGYSGIAPENTRASFERAIDIGADMIELDVQMTKDGQLVIFHDTDMARITGVSGMIADYTYAEICEMNAGSWFEASGSGMSAQGVIDNYAVESIPTLSEVLKLIGNSDLSIYLELKDISAATSLTAEQLQGFAEMVVNTVDEHSMQNRVIYASFHYDYLKQIKTLSKENKILCNTVIGNADTLLTDYPADYYGLNIETINQDTIEKLRDSGVQAYVYTANTPYQMQYAISLGAEGIVTNYPGLAKVVVHEEYSYLTDNNISSFTVPALYDYNLQEQYSDYIMQGFTKSGNTIAISAYDYSGERNSILYVMNISGELQNIVDLGFKAHTGGIAYDEVHDLLWVTGADGYVHAISWSSVVSGTYTGSTDDIIFTFDTGLVKPNGSRAASFMTIYNDMLYVGTYVDGANGKMEGHDIEELLSLGSGTYMEADICYEIPQRIQGVTFCHKAATGVTTMIMTQGHSIEDGALLSVAIEDGRTDYSVIDSVAVLPEGAEQPLMTASGLYILFESSARPYRHNSRVPCDQVWLISY